jgi:hypothetical protein
MIQIQEIRVWLAMLCFCVVGPSDGSESTSRINGVRIPGDAKVSKAQIDRSGTIHLLLNTEDGPKYVKSTNAGVTFSSSIELVDTASKKPGLEFQGEDLAVGGDGRVHVAMSNNAWKLKLPQEEWGFYYASLVPGAKAFSPVRNINRKPSEGFSLAADDRGNVSASFLSGKLFTMVSYDNGETFTAYAEPNPGWNPCDCCTTATTYGADGKLALLYREETNNDRDMYLVLSDASRKIKPSRTRVSGESWKLAGCPMTYYTVTRAPNGYVAAWPTKGEIYFARLDHNGAILPPGEIKTPGSNGMRTGVLALSAQDSATLIAWKKNEVLGWQLYDSKGRPDGNSNSAPSPGNGAAGVALPNGKFILFL